MTLIKSISGIRGTIGGPQGDNLKRFRFRRINIILRSIGKQRSSIKNRTHGRNI